MILIFRIFAKYRIVSVIFMQNWLEFPGVHPLKASHGAAWLMCQRPSHAIGERMKNIETDKEQMQISYTKGITFKIKSTQIIK